MAHTAFTAFSVLKPARPQNVLVRAAKSVVNSMPSANKVIAASVVVVAATASAGYIWHRRRKLRELTVSVDPLRTTPEGAIQGSPILEGGRVPGGQVKLAIRKGNELMIVGSGLRMEDHLVTPTHNVMSGMELYMITERERIRIDTAQEVMLAADVSAFPVPEASWALAGVSRIKMAPLASEKTVTITSGCDQTYTIGRLRSTQPMGRVHYIASTKPGYSGSAYMDGQSCVGMHNHGGAMAGGYEILYLWCRLKHALQQIPESSEDFLRRLSKKKRLQFEDLDQDFSVLKTKSGHYHLTTKETRQRLRLLQRQNEETERPRWVDEIEVEELQQELADRGRGEDSDSEADDNYRGYQRDLDSDSDYQDNRAHYEYEPHSYFPGEGRRQAMAPSRSRRQGPMRPRRVAFASSVNSAPPPPTGQQQLTSRQRLPLHMLPALLREQLRRAGHSRSAAARMSADILQRSAARLTQPSQPTAQQTPQPGPSGTASTAN